MTAPCDRTAASLPSENASRTFPPACRAAVSAGRPAWASSAPLEQPGRVGSGPGGSPSGGAATLEREDTRQLAEPGDHERFAHYVRKEKIMESAMTGEPVIALCGKVWTPGRDPQRFPVCPECKEIYEGMRGGDEDQNS